MIWGVEGEEIAFDCFSVSGELVGVVYGELVTSDLGLSVEGLKNLGNGSADGGGELRKAGPAYGWWLGRSL